MGKHRLHGYSQKAGCPAGLRFWVSRVPGLTVTGVP